MKHYDCDGTDHEWRIGATVNEDDGETHEEAVQRNIGDNALLSIRELLKEYDKVRAELAMFRKYADTK